MSLSDAVMLFGEERLVICSSALGSEAGFSDSCRRRVLIAESIESEKKEKAKRIALDPSAPIYQVFARGRTLECAPLSQPLAKRELIMVSHAATCMNFSYRRAGSSVDLRPLLARFHGDQALEKFERIRRKYETLLALKSYMMTCAGADRGGSCKQPIIVAKRRIGREGEEKIEPRFINIPMDLFAPIYRVFLRGTRLICVPFEQSTSEARLIVTSHFSTCPDAELFSRGRSRAPNQNRGIR